MQACAGNLSKVWECCPESSQLAEWGQEDTGILEDGDVQAVVDGSVNTTLTDDQQVDVLLQCSIGRQGLRRLVDWWDALSVGNFSQLAVNACGSRKGEAGEAGLQLRADGCAAADAAACAWSVYNLEKCCLLEETWPVMCSTLRHFRACHVKRIVETFSEREAADTPPESSIVACSADSQRDIAIIDLVSSAHLPHRLPGHLATTVMAAATALYATS